MLKLFDLFGKNAIIVGGAGGLGIYMVEALVEAGAKAVVIDISDTVFDIAESFENRGSLYSQSKQTFPIVNRYVSLTEKP